MSFDVKSIILSGTKLKLKYKNPYYGISFPFRPLSDYEISLITTEAMEIVSKKINIPAEKIREAIKTQKGDAQSVSFLSRYFLELKVLTIYYAMKDFCPPDFSPEDVRKMRGLNEFYEEIMKYSDMKLEELKKFFRDK